MRIAAALLAAAIIIPEAARAAAPDLRGLRSKIQGDLSRLRSDLHEHGNGVDGVDGDDGVANAALLSVPAARERRRARANTLDGDASDSEELTVATPGPEGEGNDDSEDDDGSSRTLRTRGDIRRAEREGKREGEVEGGLDTHSSRDSASKGNGAMVNMFRGVTKIYSESAHEMQRSFVASPGGKEDVPRHCELEASYEAEIADLQDVPVSSWNRFWHDERVRRLRKIGASEDHIASARDHTGPGTGIEAVSVPRPQCETVPELIKAYRLVVIEKCMPDGDTSTPAIPAFRTPTSTSECRMVVKHRVHTNPEEGAERDVEAIVVESEFENRVYVVFRATDGDHDWAHINLRLLQRERVVNNVEVGKVHRGFDSAFTDVSRKVWAMLSPYVNRKAEIVFVGHSLGGGVATIGALYTKLHFPAAAVDCITFGAPRVGNKKFARLFNEQVRNSKRVVAVFNCLGAEKADLVSTVPPERGPKRDSSDAMLAVSSEQGFWPSSDDIKKAFKKTTSAVGNAYDNTKKSISNAYDNTKKSFSEAYDKVDKHASQMFDRAEKFVIDVGFQTANRVVAAITEYEHVGGLVKLHIRRPPGSVCKTNVDALKCAMSVHGAYRRELLTFQLDEFIQTIRSESTP